MGLASNRGDEDESMYYPPLTPSLEHEGVGETSRSWIVGPAEIADSLKHRIWGSVWHDKDSEDGGCSDGLGVQR